MRLDFVGEQAAKKRRVGPFTVENLRCVVAQVESLNCESALASGPYEDRIEGRDRRDLGTFGDESVW